MSARHYVGIAVKLCSIGLLLFSIRFVPPLIEALRWGSIDGVVANGWFALLNLVMVWSSASLLWLFPLSIARRILGPELDLPVESISGPSVFTVIVASTGLVFIASSLIDSVYWSLFVGMTAESTGDVYAAESTSGVVATAIEFFVGLFLVLKCRSIVRLVSKVAS